MSNTLLMNLNMSDVEIGNSGGQALGKALARNKALRSLVLLCCSIGAHGATHLAEGLVSSLI